MRAPLRASVHDMTDDEVMARFSQRTNDPYAIPEEIIPDGMVYEWKREEVYGKPDLNRIMEAERNGWRPVPAARHDGMFMAAGTDGPVKRDGMVLMELPEEDHALGQRYWALEAKRQVRDKEAQMIYAPSGTAPRDAHPRTRPSIKKAYERVSVAIEE